MIRYSFFVVFSILMFNDSHVQATQVHDENEIQRHNIKKQNNIAIENMNISEDIILSLSNKKGSISSVEEINPGQEQVVDPGLFRAKHSCRLPLQVLVTASGVLSTILGTVPFFMGDTDTDENNKFILRLSSVISGWTSVGGTLLIRWLDAREHQDIDHALEKVSVVLKPNPLS